MAKQTRTNLEGQAGAVAAETQIGGNTKGRIGKLNGDTIASVALDFETTRAYNPGEYIIWQNRNVRCLLATTAGQSPSSHPIKWDDKVIDNIEKLTPDNGDDFPVLARALKQYVASKISNGGNNSPNVRKATPDDINEFSDDNSYVTPYLVGLVVDALTDIIITGGSPKTLLQLFQAAAQITSEHPSDIPAVKVILDYALDDLTQLRTSRAIVIENGSSSFVVNRQADNPNPQGIRIIEPDGKETSFRRLPDGTLELLNRDGQRFLLAENGLISTAQSARFDSANVRAKTTSRTSLPVATSPLTMLQGPSQFDSVKGEYRDEFYSLSDLASALLPLLGGSGGSSETGGRQTELEGCIVLPVASQASQDFVITPSMLGQSQTHNLNAVQNQIWPTMLGPDNRDASGYVTIQFPTASSFILTVDDAVVAADPALSIRLNLRKLITP